MGKFGWSYPPGCNGTPFDQDELCDECGLCPNECECFEDLDVAIDSTSSLAEDLTSPLDEAMDKIEMHSKVIDELYDALTGLYDEQSFLLCRRKVQWRAAMEKAREAIELVDQIKREDSSCDT